MIARATAMLPACKHWLAPRQCLMKVGITRRCISGMPASNPYATPCTNLPGNPRDRKPGPWTIIGANGRRAKATVWLYAPWPMFGSGPFMRYGSSTQAMSRRHSWRHDVPMASLPPEGAAERTAFAGLSTAKTPGCFFAFTGTRLPYHASAAVSREAKRLDTSKRRGRLASACVMETDVSAAAFWHRLDIEGLLYRAGPRANSA